MFFKKKNDSIRSRRILLYYTTFPLNSYPITYTIRSSTSTTRLRSYTLLYYKRRTAKKCVSVVAYRWLAGWLHVGIEVRKSRMCNRRVCPPRRAAAQPSAAAAVGRSVDRLPFNGFHRILARAPGVRPRWGLTEI